jgi:preprotein translocase subunit SecA
LRGRSGRQGDPGESRFYLSLEDDLLRIFGAEQLEKVMNVLKIKPGEPIEHPLLTRLVEMVQKKVEGINFSIRKHLMEMDTVLDAQRNYVYSLRDWILEGKSIEEHLDKFMQDFVERRIESFCNGREWDLEGLKASLLVLPRGIINVDGAKFDTSEEVKEYLLQQLKKAYAAKKQEIGEEYDKFLRFLILRVVDDNWRQYLEEVDHVKEAVNLRAYGQRDPIIEFKKETYAMFDEMMSRVTDTVIGLMFRVVKVDEEKAQREAKKDLANLRLVHEEFNIVNRAERRKLQKNEKIKRFRIKR